MFARSLSSFDCRLFFLFLGEPLEVTSPAAPSPEFFRLENLEAMELIRSISLTNQRII